MKIKINQKTYDFESEQTILDIAEKNNIEIPTLCHHADFCAKGNCRVCVVEVKGKRNLVTSCSTLAEDKMEVITNSPRVVKSRNLNIELIYAEHVEKCPTCVWRFECKLLKWATKYRTKITRFEDRKSDRKTYMFANSIEIDGTQCIDCRNCVSACSDMQKIGYLELSGKGVNQEIVPTKNKHVDCILCGQCAVHCPVSAAQEQSEWQFVESEMKSKKNVVVAQFAPSIRVSIGEDFGLPYGKVVTGQIISSLKKLGFEKVFDVNMGADVTTMVEAKELVERLQNGGTLPMFTSCCPGWVNYVEFYHPELIPNLTTARSPHMHNGGLIKTYWASRFAVPARKIKVVSIVPCTAKKYEASRPEMRIKGINPIDYTLTTREFSFLLKKNQINLAKMKESPADSLLGEYSGAAAIYGSSGGVMESALRTAQHLACSGSKDKACDTRIDFAEVRGVKGVKTAVFNLAGKDVSVAVVNGIGNIGYVLENLSKFHYIEVMACPGGCIGGGGQPIPTNWKIREKRIAALYAHDKKLKMRRAHENKSVKKALSWLEKQGHETEKSVLHTGYRKRKRF